MSKGKCKDHIPAELVVKSFSHSLITSRGEDLQVELPVLSRYASAFHFDPTLAPMLGPALIGDQVVEMS